MTESMNSLGSAATEPHTPPGAPAPELQRVVDSLGANYLALRQRLMNPPNAVPDTGIDLKRKFPSWRPARVARWRDAQELADTVWQTKLRKMMVEIAEGLDTPFVILKGQSRTFPLVRYRQAAYAIMCRLSGYSINRVAAGFNRHHTSVLLGLRKMRPHIEAVAAELPADAPAIEWARAFKRRIG